MFTLAIMSLNLVFVVSIIVGYVCIFYKIKHGTSDKLSKTKSRTDNKMFFRIFLIVATDIACWLPIILFSFANYFRYPIPDIVHSLTSIVLLPINSLLNPIIYSKYDVILIKKLKKLYVRSMNDQIQKG